MGMEGGRDRWMEGERDSGILADHGMMLYLVL